MRHDLRTLNSTVTQHGFPRLNGVPEPELLLYKILMWSATKIR